MNGTTGDAARAGPSTLASARISSFPTRMATPTPQEVLPRLSLPAGPA